MLLILAVISMTSPIYCSLCTYPHTQVVKMIKIDKGYVCDVCGVKIYKAIKMLSNTQDIGLRPGQKAIKKRSNSIVSD
jgi:hypothetical protein